MPQVIVTPAAALGLQRCLRFLAEKSPEASRRARDAIRRHFALVAAAPEMGRPFADEPQLRELVIGLGSSGYVALYRYEPEAEAVYVLAFRHQKEAGF